MVLHRTRNELNKRFEKQQKEYENKISFLIQQLRNSEVKLHENSLLLRSSFDMMEQKKKSMNEEEGDSGVDGDDQTKTRQQRPHTTPNMNRTSTLTRSLGHPHAQEDHQEMKTSTSSSADGSSSEAQEENMKLINDLKRKLDTERCRREILEKRNGELMREMRRMTTSKGEEKK